MCSRQCSKTMKTKNKIIPHIYHRYQLPSKIRSKLLFKYFPHTHICTYIYIYIYISSVAPTSTSVRMRIYLFLQSTDRPVGLVLFAYAPKKIQRSRKLIWFFVIEFNYVFIIQFCSARACASKKTFIKHMLC